MTSHHTAPHVPYIAAWSGERSSGQIVPRPGHPGIAFADEVTGERDSADVLWCRMPNAPGLGRPELGKVHPTRQRHAMRRLLCQVCGKPAKTTDNGALWLFPNGVREVPGWPQIVANAHPPVCPPCAALSIRLCPRLRRGSVAVRAHSAVICGCRGRWPPNSSATSTTAPSSSWTG
jgi:hypothetical protein